jgi:hypothetical protein
MIDLKCGNCKYYEEDNWCVYRKRAVEEIQFCKYIDVTKKQRKRVEK